VRDEAAVVVFLPNRKTKYFSKEDWTLRANQFRRVIASASEASLLLNLRDRPGRAGVGGCETHFVPRVKGLKRYAALHFERLGGAAGIRAYRAVLDLSDRDGAVEPVDLGDNSRTLLLGQSARKGRRADDGKRCSAD